MRKNRKARYLHSTIIRGRRLKDGEEAGGGAGDGNNANGNADGSGDGSQGGGNNPGQSFDPEAFWNDPEGNSAKEDEGPSDEDVGKALGEQLRSQIAGFKSDPVFTPEAIESLRNGDAAGINEAMNAHGQNLMKTMLGMSAAMMKAFESQMVARMDKTVSSSVQRNNMSQKDEQLLTENFPSYGTAANRPLVQGTFNQALRHSGGDRKKAIDMTRGMLKMMGEVGHADFGLPKGGNPDDNLGDGPSRLVAELLKASG